MIGALLGHTVPATTQRYAGLADDPRRATAEAVGRQIEALLEPQADKSVAIGTAKRRGRR